MRCIVHSGVGKRECRTRRPPVEWLPHILENLELKDIGKHVVNWLRSRQFSEFSSLSYLLCRSFVYVCLFWCFGRCVKGEFPDALIGCYNDFGYGDQDGYLDTTANTTREVRQMLGIRQ